MIDYIYMFAYDHLNDIDLDINALHKIDTKIPVKEKKKILLRLKDRSLYYIQELEVYREHFKTRTIVIR